MRKLVLPMGLLALSAIGCQPADSSDVATHGIYADISVTAGDAGGSDVYTSLRVGGPLSNTYLELTGGDQLIAYTGSGFGISTSMNETNTLGLISYHANFPGQVADTPFKVSFLRDTEVSAPDTEMTLPAPFTITAPATNTTFSRASDPITVTWSGSGQPDPMTYSIIGGCIQSQFNDTISSDSGTLTIPAGTILASTTGGGTCAVSIGILRARNGSLDPAYGEGGTARAYQNRNVTINSAP